MARIGSTGFGSVGKRAAGSVGSGRARLGVEACGRERLGRRGAVRLRFESPGWAGRRTAGRVRLRWARRVFGCERQGVEPQARYATLAATQARQGEVGRGPEGKDRQARLGFARRGFGGLEGQAAQGSTSDGMASWARKGRLRAGRTRLGQDSRGVAWPGAAPQARLRWASDGVELLGRASRGGTYTARFRRIGAGRLRSAGSEPNGTALRGANRTGPAGTGAKRSAGRGSARRRSDRQA